MNNTKLQTTHKHLTLVFTGVVFAIIILLAGTFLVTKYYNESRHERQEFLTQVDIMMKRELGETGTLQKIRYAKMIHELKQFGERGHDRSPNPKIIPISFFILDLDKNIIFENLVKEPKFTEIDYDSGEYYTQADSYIALRDLGENTIIFYQEIYYDLGDMFSDLLLLFMLAGLSGFLSYFIGYKFVQRVLTPVEANLQDMTDFVHNAGHELKTPLAVMHGNLQVMQVEKKYDQKLLKKSLGEINRANSLIEGLIELSQVGKLTEKSSLALATEVKKVVSELGDLAREKKINIDNKIQGKYILQANQQELNILLINLIKNAIKYNTSGGSVDINLEKNILSISDTGQGISEQEQEKIFDRFYRGSKVRSEDGFGIGLSLVKKIADTNNWKIEVESIQGKGSTFKIIF